MEEKEQEREHGAGEQRREQERESMSNAPVCKCPGSKQIACVRGVVKKVVKCLESMGLNA